MKIKAKNFKCFGEREQGFDEIFPMNLIIGRNNSGKSALLDLVSYTISPTDITPHGHKGRKVIPEVFVTKALTESEVRQVFIEGRSGGALPSDHYIYGRQLIGKNITIRQVLKRSNEFVSIDFDYIEEARAFIGNLATRIDNSFSGKTFRRIAAERDIQPEGDKGLGIQDNGTGATAVIQTVINNSKYDRAVVEETMLYDLNAILEPDLRFERILVQNHDNGTWEIFLEEKDKGLVSLSDSGSGLKTIILVLLHTVVLPQVLGNDLGDYVFAFEELENNLHPGVQRRLLKYIEDKAVNAGCTVFITTHSNVIIDLFSGNENAQIIHVTHNGEYAEARKVETYTESKHILDDLDIRASDLLQTNGIVWVEGVSDRIYLKHWIELYCESNDIPTPLEGSHYSFAEYGGKCLSHYDFSAVSKQESEDEDIEALIKALLINRNNYVIMDSDKSEESADIRQTKVRIRSECAEHADSWITEGREIENYIPAVSIDFSVDKYDNIAKKYGEVHKTEQDKPKTFNKKEFALETIKRIDKDNWEVHDLKIQIERLVATIHKWNNPTASKI